VDYDFVFKCLKFSSTLIPNAGGWVLENGFFIGIWGWDLIGNPLFLIDEL
jgi:hypothetical protein